jgi:hypothetical protein
VHPLILGAMGTVADEFGKELEELGLERTKEETNKRCEGDSESKRENI